MATLLMPLRADIPAYTFQSILEGALYNFEVRYNERMARWIMDISDANGTPLVRGTPIQTDFPLLDRYQNEGLPPGSFFAIDESSEGKQPERADIGNDVNLFYVESNG